MEAWLKSVAEPATTARPSLAAIANSVQAAYSIGEPGATHPEDNTTVVVSTRATFMLNLGTVSIGKYLRLYVRWYHTKHPQLAGPWSEIKVMIA